MVSTDRFLVSISPTAARSLIRNQPLSSMAAIGSLMKVRLIFGGEARDGDCVGPPPGSPAKNASARKPVTPAAVMLIATPETMWSTPKTTVASPCRAPPMTPKAIAPRTPAVTP